MRRARAGESVQFSSRSRISRLWCAKSRRRRKAGGEENTMGQKVNPVGLRLGINRTWDSRWYAGKASYGSLLHEDMEIRKALMVELKQAAVSKIVIERPHKKCRVTIHSARPGVVIGKKGADIEKLRKKVTKLTKSDVVINIVEIRKPELDAQLVAESIAQQLERRVAFRRAMKRAVQSAMRLGAGGIRINCSGRLGGAEIARMEWYREGRVPLHTLRADVDYGVATAFTTYGTCGVKVWIFKGEIMEHDPWRRTRTWRKARSGVRVAMRRERCAGKGLREANSHAATDAHQVPQGAQRPHQGDCDLGRRPGVRSIRPQGVGAGAGHRAADRGRAPRAHASYEARGPGLDSHLSGRAGVEEAARSSHGFGQGDAGILGHPHQTGARPVRGRRRVGGDGARGAWTRRRQAADQDALHRAHRGVAS